MRFRSFLIAIRTVYTAARLPFALDPTAGQRPSQLSRHTVKSMPTLPFLGSLFGTSSSSQKAMSYPTQKSDEEWRAVLSKGASVVRTAPSSRSFSGKGWLVVSI